MEGLEAIGMIHRPNTAEFCYDKNKKKCEPHFTHIAVENAAKKKLADTSVSVALEAPAA